MTIQNYLTQVCQHCGLDESEVIISVEESPEKIVIQLDVPKEDVGLFIGHRAETLAALQRMVRIVFREEYEERVVRLNINDYRQERVGQLEEKARRIAQRVIETGESYMFPYLSSYERFVVHSLVSSPEFSDSLESVSEGDGNDRRLVLRLKDGVEPTHKESASDEADVELFEDDTQVDERE